MTREERQKGKGSRKREREEDVAYLHLFEEDCDRGRVRV
jgi:hypothetical protein